MTGFLDGTRKEELRNPFSGFGNVVDVYFGGKKECYRKSFAFVRYLKVDNTKLLEEKLQGIMCRNKVLSINISKHPRKSPPKPGHAMRKPTGIRPRVNLVVANAPPKSAGI